MDRLVETTDRQAADIAPLRDRQMPNRVSQLIDELIRVTDWPMLGTVRSLQLTAEEAQVGERVPTNKTKPLISEILWGPLTRAQALVDGCDHESRSTLLRVELPYDVVRQASEHIPSALVPLKTDTRESLMARVASCVWLDQINVQYPAAANINSSTTSMEALRKSYSVVVEDKHVYDGEAGGGGDGKGEEVYTLFSYTQANRRPHDWRGTPMPWAVFELGLHCWRAAWPHLALESRRAPPTHVQVMVYHWLRKAKVGQHRDNSWVKEREQRASGEVHAPPTVAGSENSQAQNSSVMVFTTGTAPMVFTLAFAEHGAPLDCPRDRYIIHPSFQMQLGHGTLSILDPIDDLFFTHGAQFDGDYRVTTIDGDPTWWRLGWVFRWLGAEKDFYADPAKQAGMRLTRVLLAKGEEYQKNKRMRMKRKQTSWR